MNKRIYNLKLDTHDPRDIVHNFKIEKFHSTITKVDLRSVMNYKIFDQGQLGSCTANSYAYLFMYDTLKEKLPVLTPSRLFIYYNERALEGTVNEDSGAMLRDGAKSLALYGVCDEKIWPYNIDQFAVKPSQQSYKAALSHKSLAYKRVVQDLNQMKACLIGGTPFVVGIQVYSSFESDTVAQTGKVPMPNVNSEQLLGGHAICVVGFCDETKTWLCANSWGYSWGNKGYFTLPYDYLTNPNLAGDMWTITRVS